MRYEVMTEILNRLDKERRLRARDWGIFFFLGFVMGGFCMWMMV
jgi:hypothetical protein